MRDQLQRSQIYLSETQRDRLASHAKAKGTTTSALIREALDQYLACQLPVDKRALRAKAFAAWAENPKAPSLAELRREERIF